MGVAEAFRAGVRRGRSERVEHVLRREIVLGHLVPGEALRELDLAERFDVSQGSIREALMRLSEEGLVLRRARRDTHVAPASPDDIRELLHLRREIECRAAAKVLESAPSTLLADLQRLVQAMRLAAIQGDEYALLESDCLFHLRLFEAAEMPVVEPVLARCLIHTQRFKILNSREERRDLLATAERHASIIQAVSERDAAALAEALSHHITTNVERGPQVIALAETGTT